MITLAERVVADQAQRLAGEIRLLAGEHFVQAAQFVADQTPDIKGEGFRRELPG